MKVRDLLPIGSIVLLKDGEKKLMIDGIKQTNLDNNIEYDYHGILYPEGYIGNDFQFLFNHEDIDQVIFNGYQDEEREEFIDKLSLIYE